MSNPSLRVWLVDDDDSIRWVLERALRNGGMTPRAFESAEQALVALRGESPDVLMTDIRMSGQSGLELLGQIRVAQPALPVIVMTAHSDFENAIAGLRGRRVRISAQALRHRSGGGAGAARGHARIRRSRAESSACRAFRSCSAARRPCSRCSARSAGWRAPASRC